LSEPVKEQPPATQPQTQPQEAPVAVQPVAPVTPAQPTVQAPPAAPAPPKEVFDMARIPYTQGTRAYIAAQAVLRGEADNGKIAADTGLKLKTVQNVRSMMIRLRRTGAIPMSPLTSDATVVNDSPSSSPPPRSSPSSLPPPVLPPVQQPQVIPKPVAQPPIREGVPEPSTSQETGGQEERTERTDGTGQESSQEGNGRESLGKKSSPYRTLGKERNMQELREDSREGNGREFLRFPFPWEFPGGNFPAWEDFFPVGILPWERALAWERDKDRK
jgi:hypothetical protein